MASLESRSDSSSCGPNESIHNYRIRDHFRHFIDVLFLLIFQDSEVGEKFSRLLSKRLLHSLNVRFRGRQQL